MLAKLTSKNQLTLPKTVVDSIGSPEYFEVELRGGQVVLTPVRIQRGDAVRGRLEALGLTLGDVSDAVDWARSGAAAAPVAAEPVAPRYASRGGTSTRPSKTQPAKRRA